MMEKIELDSVGVMKLLGRRWPPMDPEYVVFLRSQGITDEDFRIMSADVKGQLSTAFLNSKSRGNHHSHHMTPPHHPHHIPPHHSNHHS